MAEFDGTNETEQAELHADAIAKVIEANPDKCVTANYGTKIDGIDAAVVEAYASRILMNRGYAVAFWNGQIYAAKTVKILDADAALSGRD